MWRIHELQPLTTRGGKELAQTKYEISAAISDEAAMHWTIGCRHPHRRSVAAADWPVVAAAFERPSN